MQIVVNLQARSPQLGSSTELATLMRPQMVLIPLIIYTTILVANEGVYLVKFIIGWLVLVSVYGVVTIHNNISDLEIDRANQRKDNPLTTNQITVGNALKLFYLFISIGFIAALLINAITIIWVGVYILLGWLYSGRPLLKNKGFGAVAILGMCYGVMPWVLGYLATSNAIDVRLIVVAITSFLFVVGIISLKDFKDLKGDRAHKKMTLLVRYGAIFTQRFMILLTAVAYILDILYVILCQEVILAYAGAILLIANSLILKQKKMLTSATYRGKWGSNLRLLFFIFSLLLWLVTAR